MYKSVMMKRQDKVAVALEDIPKGAIVQVTCQEETFTVEMKEGIEFGHKFAVVPISKGENVLKYGEVIGVSSKEIEAGEHVHVHNLEGTRGRGDKNESKQ